MASNSEGVRLGRDLHRAAFDGDVEMVVTLMDRGVGPTSGWYGKFCTPLHSAISAVVKRHKSCAQQRHIVQLMLERQGVDVDARDHGGCTVLCHVVDGYARTDSHAVVDDLLQAGADPNCGLWTPMHAAAASTKPEMVLKLAAAGGDPNVEDRKGFRPLHSAKAGMITALLDIGADVNARSDAGSTVLHLAASEGEPDDVRLLLLAGADETLIDNKGRAPVDVIGANTGGGGADFRLTHQHDFETIHAVLQAAALARRWRNRGWIVCLRHKTSGLGRSVVEGLVNGSSSEEVQPWARLVPWLVSDAPEGVFHMIVKCL